MKHRSTRTAGAAPGLVPGLLARLVITCLLVAVPHAAAAEWELSGYVGRAYPFLEDRLVIRLPAVPQVPGLEVQTVGTPEIRVDGGPVRGGALAYHLGLLGLEGRLDAVDVRFPLTGARYDLRVDAPPFEGATGTIAIGDARFVADRLHLLSLNLRVRSPGAVSFFASGGLSYLPAFDVTGPAPVSFQFDGLPVEVPPGQPELRLRVAPGQAANRVGVNGGLGLRVGGRVGLFGEARIFYFRAYELQIVLEDAPPIVQALLGNFEIVQFEPVVANAVAGVAIRF